MNSFIDLIDQSKMSYYKMNSLNGSSGERDCIPFLAVQ